MAHNLEMIDGEASFFSNRVPAWHNLGVVVDGALTYSEAIKQARMDYEVIKRNLINPVNNEQLDDVFGIFRTDNDAFLGVVGNRYEPIQNDFMFSFMDSVLDADGKAHYETAGVLGKGERIFIVANLSQEYDILGSGDKHKSYLVGVGSHDGKTSQRFFVSEVRVVCNNTLQLALSKAKGQGVSVRHTRDAEARLDTRLRDLKQARSTFTNTMEVLEQLAQRKVNTNDVSSIINKAFNVQDRDDASTRTKGYMETIEMLFEKNDDDAFPQFRGTAYNLLNAFTEYNDHYAEVRKTNGRGEQTIEQMRSDSAMFGINADKKISLLDLIVKETEFNQAINTGKAFSMSNAQVLGSILDSRV